MKLDLARYTSPFSNPWVVVGETLMLPTLAIAAGIWINPLDPLWVQASFPWIWLAPLLLALRYGPFPGLAGAVILLAAWLAFHFTGWNRAALIDFPKLYFLGGLILIMIGGEFSSLWVARARRAETTQAYLDQRLEYVTHQYYLLRLSHDRLEQDLISRPVSMRDALTTLRQISLEAGGPLPGADALLRLFAQYCQLEVAALHAAGNAEAPFAQVAALGQPAPLDRRDALVERALEGDTMWHVQKAGGREGEAGNLQKNPAGAAQSRYLVVAPLVTFDGERVGLLTVERLPFFALHDETLQTLDLLLGYYTDGLAMRRLAAPVRAAWPDCPPDFASELTRLTRVARDSAIGSLIVALEFIEAEGAAEGEGIGDMPEQIQRQRRMLDVTWLIRHPGEHRAVLLTLMPLAGEAAAEGYLARIGQWVGQQRGKPLLDAGVFPHQWIVGGTPAAGQLSTLLALCHVPARPALADTSA